MRITKEMNEMDSTQEQIVVTGQTSDLPTSNLPPKPQKFTGRNILIGVILVVLAFVGKTGYDWYLSTVDCTPSQLVEKRWNFLDESVRSQMAQTAGTFLLKNTQRPVLVLSATNGLAKDYTETQEPTVLCKDPEPPLMCSFTGGACNRATTGLASVGAKFYIVAYTPKTASDLDINPERTILEHFTDDFTKHQVQKLRVSFVAPTSIEDQALQALIPGGYGNTIDKEPLHFVSRASGMYPTVIDFKHVDSHENVNAVMQDSEVVLLEEQLTTAEKVLWVRDLLQQGYVLYIYPASEIYTYPIQK